MVQGADITPLISLGRVSKWSSFSAFRPSSIASIWNIAVMEA